MGPKRFTDLEQALPGIPTNILSSRLRDLEDAGLVERSLIPGTSSVAYQLTPYGRELEGPVVALGSWGAKALGHPDEDLAFSMSALMLALRGAFRPEKAGTRDVSVEIRLRLKTLNVRVRDGEVDFPHEFTSAPRLIIEATPEAFASLLRGSLDVRDAIDSGRIEIEGSTRDAARFFEMFRFPVAEPTVAV